MNTGKEFDIRVGGKEDPRGININHFIIAGEKTPSKLGPFLRQIFDDERREVWAGRF